ncbi:MAG: lysine--tRNA ligase [Acidimicrobiia bacterium]|nr:lysine--tRNA ligase [Acidimicrobiia bacterium]
MTDPSHDDDAGRSRLVAERDHRLSKLSSLRDEGIDPYPVRFDRDRTLGELVEEFGNLGAGEETDISVKVAGRVMLRRGHGKLFFATVRDHSGEIQLFVSKAVVGDDAFDRFDTVDLGDWLGVEGTVMSTRKGELSVRVERFELLAKALLPLPDKWKGLSDVDTRFRQRYVDLIVNEDARRVFAIRSAVVASIRNSLLERGFLEVETPMLHDIVGGAAARPFSTHHNSLDIDLYMRIALELHLKRLIVAGLDRVFEIGRCFRNEGLDTRHNPEFTMLEAYQAFADYHDMMDLTEHLVAAAAEAAIGTMIVELEGRSVDLTPPWRRITVADLIRESLGVTMHPSMPVTEARAALDDAGVEYRDEWGSGKLMDVLYDDRAQHDVFEPTFVIDYPREVSPLARPHRDDPHLVERFELIVAGRELANAFSELNDPVDQLARFEAGARAKAQGDPEAGDVDYDYVRALEYGMPPAGGLGIGIDRLVMLIAGVTSIREVILFPTLRPEQFDEAEFRFPDA